MAESLDYKRGYQACIEDAMAQLNRVAADYDQMALQAEANPTGAFAYVSNRARAKLFREKADLLRGQAMAILQLGDKL